MKSRKEKLPIISNNHTSTSSEKKTRPILYDFDPFSPKILEDLISIQKKNAKPKNNTETFQRKEKEFYFHINTDNNSKNDTNTSKDKFSSLFNTIKFRRKNQDQSFENNRQNNNNFNTNKSFNSLFRNRTYKNGYPNKNWNFPTNSTNECVKLDIVSNNKKLNSTEKKTKNHENKSKEYHSKNTINAFGKVQYDMKRNKTTGMLSDKTDFVLKDNNIKENHRKFDRSRINSCFKVNNKAIEYFNENFKQYINDKSNPYSLGWLNKYLGVNYGSKLNTTDELINGVPRIIIQNNNFAYSDFGLKFKLKLHEYSKISAENKFNNKKRMTKCKTLDKELEVEEENPGIKAKNRFVKNYRSEQLLKY